MTQSWEVGTLLSEIQPVEVKWLWEGRIPLGKVTILDGDPGLGKSLITLDIAARVTRGQNMPDGTPGVLGGVVIACAEDGMHDTIRPRLDAAQADVSKVLDLTLVEADPNEIQSAGSYESGRKDVLHIPKDILILEQAIVRVDARLVILDPVYSFMESRFNTNSDSQVRHALTPLTKLAERLEVAIVLVRHLNKGDHSKAIYRGGGSIGFIGLARSGLLVARSPSDEGLVLASTKCNLARRPPSLRYGIADDNLGGIPSISWFGETAETADQLIAPPEAIPESPSKQQQAADFLRSQLSDGPIPSKELEEAAKAAGISDKTYQRARKMLGIEASQIVGRWISSLPPQIVRESDGQMAKGGLPTLT